MIPLRRIAVCLFLALWLAATHHCAWETADLFDSHAVETADPCCADGGRDCAHASCQVLDGASLSLESAALKVPAPEALADGWALALQMIMLGDGVDVLPRGEVGHGRPPDWVATWHFERRSAAPARAPSLHRG